MSIVKTKTVPARVERIPKPVIYITMAYMVFLTIYTLGVRIDLFTTAFDLLHDRVPTLYWYGIMIRWGGLLCPVILFFVRRSLLRFDTIVLGVLLLWMVFCAFMNGDTGWKDNLHGAITITVSVVLFYLVGRFFTHDTILYILRRMFLWGSVIWNIGCVISLGMFFMNYHGYYMFGGFNRQSRQGLMDGRLFGCFSDPNYAALISLLLIAGLVYFYIKNKESFAASETSKKSVIIAYRIVQIYMIISMVLPFIYIVLSGSRAVYIAGLAAIVLVLVLVTYRQRKQAGVTDGRLKAYGLRILLSLVAIAAAYVISLYGMQGLGAIITPDRDTKVELERNDVGVENISNSRFRIWGDYLTLWKDQPVYGFSTVGALKHAMKLDPESYLSKKKYNPHSMFVQMLVQTGVVGFLLMMVFWIRAVLRIGKRCVRRRELSRLFILSVFWLVLHGIFCIFNVGIFITPCFEAALVWIGLGYMEASCERAVTEEGQEGGVERVEG